MHTVLCVPSTDVPSGVRVVESTSRGVDPASRHVYRSHHGVPAQREWGVGREGHAVPRLQPTLLRLQGDLHLRHLLRHHAGRESKLKEALYIIWYGVNRLGYSGVKVM